MGGPLLQTALVCNGLENNSAWNVIYSTNEQKFTKRLGL